MGLRVGVRYGVAAVLGFGAGVRGGAQPQPGEGEVAAVLTEHEDGIGIVAHMEPDVELKDDALKPLLGLYVVVDDASTGGAFFARLMEDLGADVECEGAGTDWGGRGVAGAEGTGEELHEHSERRLGQGDTAGAGRQFGETGPHFLSSGAPPVGRGFCGVAEAHLLGAVVFCRGKSPASGGADR